MNHIDRGMEQDNHTGTLFLYDYLGGIMMPNVEVSCSISNCTFHAEGNICGANQITIDMDHQSKYDSEFSQEFGFANFKEEASHSADTCCKTFKQKSK